ncbi:MAG: hypothetical protein LBG58_12965 [Planctomycetaceae bacterium]|nr:hypothetical protein [Planctomycetaceae bacterium]
MMAGAIAGGIAGMSIGGIYGAVTKGTVIGTLKYAALGGITGAAIGAALAGTVWVSAYGGSSVLTNVLKLGYKDFLKKMGGRHLGSYVFFGTGFALGGVAGYFDNDIQTWEGHEKPDNTLGKMWDHGVDGILLNTSIYAMLRSCTIVAAARLGEVQRLLTANGAQLIKVKDLIRQGVNGLNRPKYVSMDKLRIISNSAKGVTTWTTAFLLGFTLGYETGICVSEIVNNLTD